MTNFNHRTLLLLTGTVMLLASCGSGPKDANDANFTKALNNYYAERPECFTLPTTKNDKGYDYIVAIADDSKALGKQRNETGLKPYIELADLGIYTAEKTNLEEKFFSQTKMVPAMGFKLTEKAKANLYIPTSRHETFLNSDAQLCYGNRQVVRIENFTEPAQAIGVTASQVKYTYKIVDVADWASGLSDSSSFSNVRNRLGVELEDQDDMILTDDGWVHHKAFSK